MKRLHEVAKRFNEISLAGDIKLNEDSASLRSMRKSEEGEPSSTRRICNELHALGDDNPGVAGLISAASGANCFANPQ